MNNNFKHSDFTNIFIKAYYNVYNKLGFGFLEKAYETSIMIEAGLLLNFGQETEFKRKVLTNEYKF